MEVIDKEDIESGKWITFKGSNVTHKISATPKDKTLKNDSIDLVNMSKYPHEFKDINPNTVETKCDLFKNIDDIISYFDIDEGLLLQSSLSTVCPECSNRLITIAEWD